MSALALAAALTPTPALAAPSEDDLAAAQAAYDEGEKAYRLGKFDEAAEAFETAYELSDFPDILYNIGLAHLRWFDVDPEVRHLRKARVVFQNYTLEIQKNPELGDLAEAETLIAEIDDKIAAAEAREVEHDQGRGAVEPPVPSAGASADPGKGLRLGGAASMGIGGALIVAGVVGGAVIGVRSQEFEQDLAATYAAQASIGCVTNDMRPECIDLEQQANTQRDNGQLANALGFGLGLGLGGVGVLGVVAGAVLFVQGNKKTKRWEQNQLSVMPRVGGSIFGGSSGGLTISGKF